VFFEVRISILYYLEEHMASEEHEFRVTEKMVLRRTIQSKEKSDMRL
jgi:hypothetical protein